MAGYSFNSGSLEGAAMELDPMTTHLCSGYCDGVPDEFPMLHSPASRGFKQAAEMHVTPVPPTWPRTWP